MCLPGKYIQVDGGRDGVADAVERGRLAGRTRVLGSVNRNREVVVGGEARLGMSPPAAPNRTGPRNSKPRSWR